MLYCYDKITYKIHMFNKMKKRKLKKVKLEILLNF